MRKVSDKIAAHFSAHRRRARWPFFWRITLEGLVVSLVAVFALAAITGELTGRPALEKLSVPKLIIYTCVVAPVIETAALQAVPIMIARAVGTKFWMQVLISVVPFAALHFVEGIGVGVGAGLVGGYYLAFTYARWREESFSSAFAMTVGSHALRNAFAIAFLVAARAVIEPEQRPNKSLEPTTTAVTPRATESKPK